MPLLPRALGALLLVGHTLAAVPASAAVQALQTGQDRGAAAAAGGRTSRWWFHTLNSSFTDQAVALVRKHRDACTGVYLYMDTGNSSHSGPGRFIIGPGGVFSSASDVQIAARVQPLQALGVTVSVSLTPATSAILDGSAHKGIAAAVATATRHNLTGLMVDYEPDDPKVPKATHELA
jgi:hypothetical protein